VSKAFVSKSSLESVGSGGLNTVVIEGVVMSSLGFGLHSPSSLGS
jgi:hypothetical protein